MDILTKILSLFSHVLNSIVENDVFIFLFFSFVLVFLMIGLLRMIRL